MADPNAQTSHVSSVMEDPSSQAVARTYADALLDAAGTGTDDVLEELGSFVDDVLAKLPELREVFFARVIGREEKIRLIDRVFGPRTSPLVANFLRVLVRHDRLEIQSRRDRFSSAEEIEPSSEQPRHPRSRPVSGSRRRHRARLRPVRRHGRRNGRVHPHGVRGLVFNLEESSSASSSSAITSRSPRATRSAPPAAAARAGRRGADRPRRRSAGQSARRQGADRHRGVPARRIDRPGVAGRQPVNQPLQTGHQGHRLDDPDRPRPARADHRRPQDRQDGHRHRHDHQSARKRHLRLRRHAARRNRRSASSKTCGATARWITRSSSSPRPPTPPRCNTSPPMPAPPWPSTSCTSRARTRCASTTTCRSRRRPIASCRC
jgi:hypothetical protein